MPDWRIASIFPALSLADENGASDFDDAAAVLFQNSAPNRKVLVSHVFQDPFWDRFVNFWNLQQTAVRGPDDIREFAYTLEPHDPASMCIVLTRWGPDVRVLTRLRVGSVHCTPRAPARGSRWTSCPVRS
jgi:hypothetical protein